jgi:hypothetical protein
MPSAICPYLGLIDDPETCLAFPTERNSCQRTIPVELISLEHQATYCLTYKYTECPIYMGETGPAFSADQTRARRSKLVRQGCIVIWLVVVMIGIAALLPFLSNYQSSGNSQNIRSQQSECCPAIGGICNSNREPGSTQPNKYAGYSNPGAVAYSLLSACRMGPLCADLWRRYQQDC